MNLSLTGNLGSGKSSLGKELIARGFEIVSSGDIFRGLAAERGVSIVEMNKIAETDKSIDKMVDDRTIALGKAKDNTIFDSRMGWYFVPDSFKVFVMVDLAEAGRRVYNDSLRKAETYQDERAAVEALYTRQSLEKERYEELYGVNYYNLDNYDLVIDSTSASPVQIAEEIIKRFEQYKAGDHTKHIEISPYRIYPTRNCGVTEHDFIVETFSDSTQTGKCGVKNHAVVKTALADGKWYALSGHETLLAAQMEKNPFVCISVSKESAVSTRRLCEEYEKKAGFSYRAYPEEKQEFSNEKMYW